MHPNSCDLLGETFTLAMAKDQVLMLSETF